MKAPAVTTTTPSAASGANTVWRCGGRVCPPGTCDHDGDDAGDLHRHATGPAAAHAPDAVHDVLSSPGTPLPAPVRDDMEERLGHDFADIRVHTDARAADSALQVAARAYTVARHLVFAAGEFDPGSHAGRRLLVHELSHAATYAPGTAVPTGPLRVSSPDEPAERAARATESPGPAAAPGAATPQRPPAPARDAPALLRQPATVPLRGLSVNHDRVTVPPEPGLSFSARLTPATASNVALSVVGDNATISAGTSINPTTKQITVAAAQAGGSAHVEASQSITTPTPGGGSTTNTSTLTSPFNFTAIPGAISSTSATTRGHAGSYGGDFVHTFRSPGAASALERSHVNERFATATGTTLRLSGDLGTLTISVNDPDSPRAGWDLDASGAMAGPDQVTWSHLIDARPLVRNASNPTPAHPLPQALTAAQSFRNLSFPSRTYSAAGVAGTTHRRAIEDRANLLKAVTSANAPGINEEVEENYAGPTIFRRCRATPAQVEASAPAPARGPAPTPNTVDVDVDAEGQAARPTFSVRPPALGCRFTGGGTLTIGTTVGVVTVRAGNATNFDETRVTITAPPASTTTPTNPAPTNPAPTNPTPGGPRP